MQYVTNEVSYINNKNTPIVPKHAFMLAFCGCVS